MGVCLEVVVVMVVVGVVNAATNAAGTTGTGTYMYMYFTPPQESPKPPKHTTTKIPPKNKTKKLTLRLRGVRRPERRDRVGVRQYQVRGQGGARPPF